MWLALHDKSGNLLYANMDNVTDFRTYPSGNTYLELAAPDKDGHRRIQIDEHADEIFAMLTKEEER